MEQAQGKVMRAEGGADCAKSAGRDKHWNELGLEEKVERLRVALRLVNAKASQASATAGEAYSVAHRHEHGGQGKTVMPVEGGANRSLGLLGGRGEQSDRDFVEN